MTDSLFDFLHRSPAGTWSIDTKRLNKFLIERELIRLMGENLEEPALRIIRMLIAKGKLDEKSLQEIGLLGAKELRQCLSHLQSMGFLELQEVPREAQRQPNRTIFLWFYDADRVRKLLLGRLYTTISRIYQRMEVEKRRLASTLDKIERTDVQGSEQEMLSAAELQVLHHWRRTEAWFMTEINRIDKSIAILHDLS
jgi:DNA-directed RNA polymerase III subunit RPC3